MKLSKRHITQWHDLSMVVQESNASVKYSPFKGSPLHDKIFSCIYILQGGISPTGNINPLWLRHTHFSGMSSPQLLLVIDVATGFVLAVPYQRL